MSPLDTPAPTSPKRLDQARNRVRLKHYGIRTEAQNVPWIRRFILPQVSPYAGASGTR